MTPSKAVAKARRELNKILMSDYERLSNEGFRIGKLQKFIDKYVNTKGNRRHGYHLECDYIEEELNKILSWDISQLNVKNTNYK